MLIISLVVILLSLTNIAIGYGLAVYLQRTAGGASVAGVAAVQFKPVPPVASQPAVPVEPSPPVAEAQSTPKPEIARDQAVPVNAHSGPMAEEPQTSTAPSPPTTASRAESEARAAGVEQEPAAVTRLEEPTPSGAESAAAAEVAAQEVAAEAVRTETAAGPESPRPEIEEQVLAGIEAFREQLAKLNAQPEEPEAEQAEPTADQAAVDAQETTAAAAGR